MSRVEQLLSEYREAFARGDADPTPFLDQLEGVDRKELDTLIDRYLMTAPRRKFDASDYAGSKAEQIVANVVEHLDMPPESTAGVVAGGWPELLPSLRNRAKLKRSQVVAELAMALGAQDDRERAEVADYYHEMEFGTLPPEGVSGKVLSALGKIYGVSSAMIRKSGESFRGPVPGSPAPLYTRQLSDQAFKDPSPGMASPSFPESDSDGEASGKQPGPSRIDTLFTGGDA